MVFSREDLTPRQEEPPVRGESVAVGHPRHEVYSLGGGVSIAGRPFLRALQIVLEERRNDPGRLLVLPRTRIVVHVPEKPRPQRLIHRLRERYLTFRFRVRNHVSYEGIDPVAHLFSED